jgi:prepilin-type N-terminal cleavage/methylation domain-containing protein
MQKRSFSLLELIVVVIIVGVLATLGFYSYGNVKEQTLDREAKVNLKLLRAAERIYFMETNQYYASGYDNIAGINQNLKLSLPGGDSRSWDYRTVNVTSYSCAEASRFTGPARSWRINTTVDEEEPTSGSCPP